MKTSAIQYASLLAAFILLFSFSAKAQGGSGTCGSIRAQGCIGDDLVVPNCSSLPDVIEYRITLADVDATPGPNAFFCVTTESNSLCPTRVYEGLAVTVDGKPTNGTIKGRMGQVVRVEPVFGGPTGIVCVRQGDLHWSLRVKE